MPGDAPPRSLKLTLSIRLLKPVITLLTSDNGGNGVQESNFTNMLITKVGLMCTNTLPLYRVFLSPAR